MLSKIVSAILHGAPLRQAKSGLAPGLELHLTLATARQLHLVGTSSNGFFSGEGNGVAYCHSEHTCWWLITKYVCDLKLFKTVNIAGGVGCSS
jgi:hypothetical protein